jgi:hypothetical protein
VRLLGLINKNTQNDKEKLGNKQALRKMPTKTCPEPFDKLRVNFVEGMEESHISKLLMI